MLTVGGLFGGIGGWELGLERAGMRVLWHCESDPYCQRVLARHWPGVPCYPDVSELRGTDAAPVDILCGGFPCQDLSYASAAAASGSPAPARVFGQSTPVSLASYDPDTSSWRTFQLSLLEDLSASSVIWPRAGMTRSGIAFRLRPLAPLTDETASGLLATPTTKANQLSPSMMKHPGCRAWATPTAWLGRREAHAKGTAERWHNPERSNELSDQVAAVEEGTWPTPTASRRSGLQSHGVNAISGALNPTWVEWLMGFPLGWTDLGASETRSSRRSPNGSDGGS